MKRGILVASATCVALMLGVAIASAHPEAYKSRVTIQVPEVVSPTSAEYAGRLVAFGTPGCRRGRTVRVFRKAPGKDPLIGVATTRPPFSYFTRWNLTGPASAAGAVVYAKVTAKSIGRRHRTGRKGPRVRHKCAADRSDNVRAP